MKAGRSALAQTGELPAQGGGVLPEQEPASTPWGALSGNVKSQSNLIFSVTG